MLFTVATSGVTAYAANRVLQVYPPAADGAVTLDFNLADGAAYGTVRRAMACQAATAPATPAAPTPAVASRAGLR